MKPRRYSVLSLSLLSLTALWLGCSTPQTIVDRYSQPFHQITIGLCEDYPEESRSLEAAHRDLLFLKTNNIRALRIAFGWDAMEPERGRFDWSFWDDFIKMSDAFGIQLIPYICYTPKWASSDQGTNFWRAPPRDPNDFKNFVAAIVRRYKSSIHSWELWNEPDNPAYWSGSVEQFAELLRAGNAAVRAVDPKANVVSGGIAWNLDFLRQLFEKQNAAGVVDVVNIHNYNETWSAEPLEDIYAIAHKAEAIISNYGSNQPIWFAEVGYSDYRKGDFVSEVYRARHRFEHTQNYQAVSVGRAITQVAASGKAPLFAWYRIHDLPQQQDIIGDVNNRHLGLLGTNDHPKPALMALKFFHQLYSTPFRGMDHTVQMINVLDSDVVAHAFENNRNEFFVVIWRQPIRLGPGEAKGAHHFDLRFPFHAETAEFLDENGVSVGTQKLRRESKKSVLTDIVLHPGELRVVQLH